ncbi:MAG TPA: glycosyltransferase [Acidimicrobiales bacterium]|jgi:D-inositol-3-phosphate glycosyltransferase|nr:glycosyltransferase [Acidimicrobiales bacterium]
MKAPPPTNPKARPVQLLALHVDQTSADFWHPPGELILTGRLDNVPDPDAAQVRIQLGDGETAIAQLSVLDQEEAGRTSLEWTVRLSPNVPATGSLAATVLATVGRQSVAVRRNFAVVLGRNGPTGELYSPAQDAEISGDVLAIHGWCLFPGSRTSRVAVFVDGDMVGLARTYTECSGDMPQHPDVALCGFESVLNVRRSERADTTTVSVEATSLDGRRWRSPVHVVTWAARPWDWEEAIVLEHVVERNTHVVRNLPTDRSSIVVFTHDLGFAGGPLWLHDLLRSVVSRGGTRCEVVSLNDGSLRPGLEAMGIEVHLTSKPLLGSASSFEGFVHEMALFIRARRAGVVLVNTLLPFPAVLAAESANVPSVWAIHESIEPATFFHHYGRSGFYGDMALDFHPFVRDRFEASFQMASALLFESAQTEALFQDIRVTTPSLVVGYEVDTGPIDGYRARADRDKLRCDAGFDESDIVLLVVGVFDPRKSIGMLVAAFDELSLVHEHLRLTLVGSIDRSYTGAVCDMVQRARHPSRIRVVPATTDIYPYYAMADFLVSASDLESVPRSFMEAMAFDLPIVAADAFGVQDLLQDAQTGWLTRPRDLEGLVGLLSSVLTRPPGDVAAVTRAAHDASIRRNKGPGYGDFYADALDALLECPDADLADTWREWTERKGKA